MLLQYDQLQVGLFLDGHPTLRDISLSWPTWCVRAHGTTRFAAQWREVAGAFSRHRFPRLEIVRIVRGRWPTHEYASRVLDIRATF